MTSIILFVLVAFHAAVPNDSDFENQWSLYNTGQPVDDVPGTPGADIGAVEAWDIHSGVRPVVVAIIGSGVDPHEEFADRLLTGHVTNRAGGDPYSTLDVTQTGTRAAGIVAAKRNNGLGIAGLHDGALILPVRVASSANVNLESVAEGIVWSVDNGAEIALILVQLYETHPSIADAIAYAAQNGVILIAPAGHQDSGDIAFPASLPECIAVTSTTSDDAIADFSNFGPAIDLAAPGELIWSTLGTESYGYYHQGDTFLAAAHVAGVAALIRSYSPGISAADLREILEQTADDLGDPGIDEVFGNGRLNSQAAMLATPRPLLHLEPVTPPPTSIRPLQSVSFPVRVTNGTGTLNPTSPEIVYRTAPGPFTGSSRMTLLGNNLYSATLPAFPCDTTVEFYLIAGALTGLTVTDPALAPDKLYTVSVDSSVSVFHDDFEDDLGWEVSSGGTGTGAWVRDDPVGTFSGNAPVQPEYDRSQDLGVTCYLSGQHSEGSSIGSNDVDGGPFVLTSPVIDITNRQNVQVQFAAWVYSSVGTPDNMLLELSRNGGSTWHPLLSIPPDTQWDQFVINLDSFPSITGNSLQARFTISDTPADSLTEAAIDEFRVVSQSCAPLQGDANSDGAVNLRDLGILAGCAAGPAIVRASNCAITDTNNDIRVDLRDVAVFLRNATNP